MGYHSRLQGGAVQPSVGSPEGRVLTNISEEILSTLKYLDIKYIPEILLITKVT